MFSKNELLSLWHKYKFRAKKRYGQNFLVDGNVRDKIIHFIDPSPGDVILEIGAGFGEMTLPLAGHGASVTALEKDRRIVDILRREILAGSPNIELLECDCLEYEFHKPFNKVVGNLPYYITTPIIEKLLSAKGNIKAIFIMVQREYADRMAAKAGSKEYSSLSCFIQYRTRIRKLMTIRNTCFFPAPKIDSVFLEITPLESPTVSVKHEGLLFKLIRLSFQQRRKTLRSSLVRQKILKNKGEVAHILESLGINVNARPEDLSLEEFNMYSRRIRGLYE